MKPSRGKRDNSSPGSLPQEVAERAKTARLTAFYPEWSKPHSPQGPESDKRSRQILARAAVKLALPKLPPDEDDAGAAKRMAHLVGICPACGDGGFWIDNSGFHYCRCPAGVKLEKKDRE